jgi:hypothetical protein
MKKTVIFLLVLIPFVAQLVVLPWVNQIHPFIMGFPFLHFWLFIWMLLTPLFTYCVYLIQGKGEAE